MAFATHVLELWVFFDMSKISKVAAICWILQLMTIVPEMEKEGGLRVVIVGGEPFVKLACEAFIVNIMIGGMMGAATAYYLKQLGHGKVSR